MEGNKMLNCSYIACMGISNILEGLKFIFKTPRDNMALLKFQLIAELKEFFEEENYRRYKYMERSGEM